MNTIYDSAMRSFRAAADILEALQSTRIDLVKEARTGLVGRPRLNLGGGYNDVTPSFGACLPGSGRAEILAGEGSALELRCSGSEWMTLEGTISPDVPATSCYIEMQVSADRPIVADVFLREFRDDDTVFDSGHREVHLEQAEVSVCRVALPEAEPDVTGRRIIIHVRQPSVRMVLDRLAVTLT